MARKKSFFDGFLYVINTITAFALLCAYLSHYVDPRYFSWFSFLGLAYPYLLLSNLLFAIWWALRLKIKIILPVVAIAIGYNEIPKLYQIKGQKEVVSAGEKLKVMSFNVRMFNVFNWLDDDNIPSKIEALIKETDPDILILQEYHQVEEPKSFGYPYQHKIFSDKAGATGQLILSKYPLSNSNYQAYKVPEGSESNGGVLYCDVDWKGQKIRVFNAHLASVGLADSDYQNLAHLNDKNTLEIKRDLGKISGDLKRAFVKRSYQTETLDSLIRTSDTPIILAGDFNDPPCSYTYSTLTEQLEDSFLSAGEGLVRTYNRGPLPLRIDYVLYDKGYFRCTEYQVMTEKLSDHYPVITEFARR